MRRQTAPENAEPALSVDLDMTVAFYDVDAYRVVWHGNYARYFEIARCALLEVVGFPYRRMEETGYFFPIVDMQTRFARPLVFQQPFQVTASLREWRSKLIIDYVIHDSGTGELIARASTVQVAVAMPDQITQFESPAVLIDAVDAALSRQS